MPSRSPGGRPEDEGRLIQAVYYLYLGASAIARAIPERLVYFAAHSLGSLWARLGKKKRAVVMRNLARVTGLPPGSAQLDRIVDDAFRSYARYWLETFRLVRKGKEFFLERVHAESEELLDYMTDGKRPVIVVPHLGNWDAAGAWVAATGRSGVVTVAEVLKPRRMFDFFVAHREALGMTIHPAEKGVSSKLAAAIEQGRVVPILGDRDLKQTGPVVDFFGAPAHFPAGSAAIALRTGTSVIVAGIYSTELTGGRWGWTIEFRGPIDLPNKDDPDAVHKLTQEIARYVEHAIAKHPEEWHVFQPFWKADRES